MKKNWFTLNDLKLTRREFLRLAGVSAAAGGLGYGAGALSRRPSPPGLSLQAFLPAGEDLAARLVEAFASLAGLPAQSCAVRISRLDRPVPSDLLLSDERVSIYDPQRHFNAQFATLRQQIRGIPADLSLKAVFAGRGRLLPGAAFAFISDHRGSYDRIPLSRDYNNILVDGPLGKTSLRITDGKVWVQAASCRQHLCQQAGPLEIPGDRTACAPNRLLIEIGAG